MIRAVARVAVALALAAISDSAIAEKLIVSLNAHQVRVSSNFAGTDLVLFGYVERNHRAQGSGPYDVVVIVKGPARALVLRRKERTLGIWTTGQSHTYPSAPSYLSVLTNRPPTDFTAPQQQTLTEIAHTAALDLRDSDETPANAAEKLALISAMQDRGLYILRSDEVTFLTPTLFRANIHLPPETPVGNYDVEASVFANGRNVAQSVSAFEVFKVGLEQFLASSAQTYSLFYGLCVALMAAATGWSAALAFRRD